MTMEKTKSRGRRVLTKLSSAALALSALGLTSCASSAPMQRRAENSAAAIRAADEVGAAGVPRASLHLQLAKEEAQKARQLDAGGDPERGASLMLRSEADANLAVALARAEASKAKAAAAAERLRQLRKANP